MAPHALPRTSCALGLVDVARIISGARFPMDCEARTQRDLEAAFVMALARSQVSREHRLGPGDRPDFLIDARFVVEVKGPRHRQAAVQRQLARYAAYPEVEAIVLATSKAMAMPAAIGGKPVRVVNLGRAWL